jgi:hypothetical protein
MAKVSDPYNNQRAQVNDLYKQPLKILKEADHWRHKYVKDGMAKVSDSYNNERAEVNDLKGSLTRDFRHQILFINQCPPGP